MSRLYRRATTSAQNTRRFSAASVRTSKTRPRSSRASACSSIMKLAASNIGWEPEDDVAVAAILRDRGFTGVEIAPGKRWESPVEATKQEIAAYRTAWE